MMFDSEIAHRKIAYFTMEIGLESHIPTYSGGLGVLAGDTIKACADLGIPIIAITLLNEKGHFFQQIDSDGNQSELPAEWEKEKYLQLQSPKINIIIEGRPVQIQVWGYLYTGIKGFNVPVYFLDSNLPENNEYDRTLTWNLYGGDDKYRFCQEIILGMGGLKMVEALGYKNIEKYHLNEGHASLLILELLERYKNNNEPEPTKKYAIDKVKKKCIFTTHTPVPAGHDKFSPDLVRRILQSDVPFDLKELFFYGDELNMTLIGLNFSSYINGVAKRHSEVSRGMFPGYPIESITNGIHPSTWVAPAIKNLFDRYIPEWESDTFTLRNALNIPKEEIWQAHMQNKIELIDFINSKNNIGMDYDTFTIGFARRATPYKRMDLLLSDKQRIKNIHHHIGKIQIIYSGKAHPLDHEGKKLIKKIFDIMKELAADIKIVYLENYDMNLGKLMTSGCDLWLNTPLRPREASGTSGMKSCLNGVPNLSVMDGWWIEGHIENITGWSINGKDVEDNDHDAIDMYRKLEQIIIPMYYKDRDKWLDVMQHTIALNASFFNAQRMVHQYALHAYFKSSLILGE